MNTCPCCGQSVPTDSLLVSLDTNTASRNGVTISLTPSETEILFALARRFPSPASRDALLLARFGRVDAPGSNIIDAMLSHMRKAVGALGVRIVNVPYRGWRLVYE